MLTPSSPLADLPGLLILVLCWLSMIYGTRATRWQSAALYEGIIYLSEAERILAIHSIHSIHAREPRSNARNAERWPLIKGQRGGCHGVTEMGATRAIKYLDKKACIGFEAVHIGGAVPFFDSSSANFPLCDAGVIDDIVRGA